MLLTGILMKVIKYLLLATILVSAIAYVDIQVNAMFSEPKLLIFEKLCESVKNALK